MPNPKKVEKTAQRVVDPLNKIVAWKYESPFDERESSRETLARTKHKADFDTMQKTAKGSAATIGRGAAAIIQDQHILEQNMNTIKTSYGGYEKPFKTHGNTGKIANLLMEVNAAARYWQEVVTEIAS